MISGYSGMVTIGGVDLSIVNQRKLRACLGIVRQDSVLFGGSILENVTGGAAFDPQNLTDALEFAGATKFVVALPAGVASDLVRQGHNLSGGQRQRLAIARAHYRNPPIAIFDEPTSFLDAEAAVRLEKRISDWSATRLVLLVTHNFMALRHGVRIIVLDGGRIVGDGTHDQLLVTCPEYASLWQASLREDHPAPKID